MRATAGGRLPCASGRGYWWVARGRPLPPRLDAVVEHADEDGGVLGEVDHELLPLLEGAEGGVVLWRRGSLQFEVQRRGKLPRARERATPLQRQAPLWTTERGDEGGARGRACSGRRGCSRSRARRASLCRPRRRPGRRGGARPSARDEGAGARGTPRWAEAPQAQAAGAQREGREGESRLTITRIFTLMASSAPTSCVAMVSKPVRRARRESGGRERGKNGKAWQLCSWAPSSNPIRLSGGSIAQKRLRRPSAAHGALPRRECVCENALGARRCRLLSGARTEPLSRRRYGGPQLQESCSERVRRLFSYDE